MQMKIFVYQDGVLMTRIKYKKNTNVSSLLDKRLRRLCERLIRFMLSNQSPVIYFNQADKVVYRHLSH